MVRYSGDIEKRYVSEYFSNRYILEATDLNAAVTALDGIKEAERAITSSDVVFTKMRVSSVTEGDDVFRIVTLGEQGMVAIASGDLMPLFVVARVNFLPATGRASMKYLRGVLAKADLIGAAFLSPAKITFIESNYIEPMMLIPEYVDVDGQAFLGGSVAQEAGNRQLRRGSRRGSTPII